MRKPLPDLETREALLVAVCDVRVMRARLDRAEQNGQTELHVDLGTMELITGLAEMLLDVFLETDEEAAVAGGDS